MKDDLGAEIPEREIADFTPYIDRYTFPYWNTEYEYEYRYLEVVNRGRVGDDRWAIMDSPHCYNKRTGEFEYEPSPSNREDDFLRDCRMPLAEALEIVTGLVRTRYEDTYARVTRIIARQTEVAARKEQQG